MWKDAADPLRTCPDCGREEQTRFEHCPHCGASYFGPSRSQRRRRRRFAALGVAVAVAGLAVAVPLMLADASDREEREAAEHERVVAAEIARLKRVQAPHRGSARQLRPPAGATQADVMRARAALVEHVQDVITRDARARERAGELDGPITHTECGPIERRPDAVPAHLIASKKLGRYDCVAVKSDVRQHGKSVARLGHPFVTTLNFTTYTYTWCRTTPAQSERGKALATVRLARACLAAKGKAVGSGYLDVPGS